MKEFKKTAIAVGVAQVVWMASGVAFAQTAPATDSSNNSVVVVGQRASLESAQKLKQHSDEVVDSIVADDIGKLPDRSVTEVLQRVVGVTIDRTPKGDPEHFSVEGSGVVIRGLSYVRSELNGRDSFSSNGGRALNFEDVPPELMAGVDVYKNPSAEQIEGGISGLVNLRTAMPFDFKDRKFSFSAQDTYSTLKKGKPQPSYSLLASDRWKTGLGEFGALVDLASSESGTRTDAFQVEPYYPRTDIVNGQTVWVPKGAQWRTLEFDRKREGLYGAFQWRLNDKLESSLTYFKSRYNQQAGEQAIFAASNGYNINVANGVYDAKGALLTGVLSNTADGGINFSDDTQVSSRKSQTTDISWHVKWRPTNSWTVTTDLQRVRATTDGFSSTVATGLLLPKEQVDLSTNPARLTFDQSDLAILADPSKYHWDFTMEHMDRSVATEKAWRTDAKYEFDHPILRDLRFGVRLTDRDAVSAQNPSSYHWQAISESWTAGGVALLSDYPAGTHLNTFPNFFNGSVAVPSVVFPDVSLATGYPGSYIQLHNYGAANCKAKLGDNAAACNSWPFTFTPESISDDQNSSGYNSQQERTKAFYTQLRFGFDDLKYPVDGNVGLRYVKTDMSAHGYTTFSTTPPQVPAGYTVIGGPIPNIPAFAAKQDADNSYSNVLPSLNLRLKADDKLQFRFAYSQAMSRPDFSQLQSYTTLSENTDTTTNDTAKTFTINNVSLTGTGSGNPKLKPTTSRNLDLTAEWYFAPAGSLTFAVFNKKLKDIIVNQSYTYPLPDVNGKLYNFTVTGPVNGANGTAKGFEVAYQQYFDKLGGWMSGFGVQANYTYVDSHQNLHNPVNQAYCSGGNTATNMNLNMNGCDVDGKTFGNLPLQYLSRNSYNLALLYDKGPISARISYNWREKSLEGVNVNGTRGDDGLDTNPNSPTYGSHNNVVSWALPTWSDDYGQVDAGFFYKFTDNLTLGIEAQNLTNSTYRQLMQQGIGFKTRAWFSTGPRYTAQLRYTF